MSSPTSTTSAPSTSSACSFPTNTAINTGNALCFSNYNDDGKYQSFTLSDAQKVIDAFCENNYVLDPGNTYGYVENGANNIYVSISWTEDQSGCGTEVDFPFGVPLCEDAWDLPLAICSSGCVLIEIEALTSEDAHTVINPHFSSAHNSSQTQWYAVSRANPTLDE
ncbi:hypothetical protein TMatcc_006591 [Talaromyces marneffei ATCC 18224]